MLFTHGGSRHYAPSLRRPRGLPLPPKHLYVHQSTSECSALSKSTGFCWGVYPCPSAEIPFTFLSLMSCLLNSAHEWSGLSWEVLSRGVSWMGSTWMLGRESSESFAVHAGGLSHTWLAVGWELGWDCSPKHLHVLSPGSLVSSQSGSLILFKGSISRARLQKIQAEASRLVVTESWKPQNVTLAVSCCPDAFIKPILDSREGEFSSTFGCDE